jgi:hypothetical protein
LAGAVTATGHIGPLRCLRRRLLAGVEVCGRLAVTLFGGGSGVFGSL